jgi:DNA modification methylase
VSDLPRRAGLDYGAWASGGLVPPRRDDWLGPFRLDAIYQGDARQLAKYIPDESVDLIFTDPVYDRIDDYRWLAETAVRVLKPNRACLVWAGSDYIGDILHAMMPFLTYRLIFTIVFPGFPRWMNRIGLKSKRLLWMDRGGFRPYQRIYDIQYSDNNRLRLEKPVKTAGGQDPDGLSSWDKNLSNLTRFIQTFTTSNQMIHDPFTGGGTVPAVCKQLGRRYLAFEIDHQTCLDARQRVAQTQPPLFVLEPEQLALPEVAA